MIKDALNSIKVYLYEKTTSPLLGAFAISWALWNYRFILVLTSSASVEEKFEIIGSQIFCSTDDYLLNGLLYPAITTLLYIFIYPYPARWVYSYSRNRQRELKEVRQQIDDETPLTKEESRAVRREALNIEITLQTEIDRRDHDIQRLKEEIESLSNVTTIQSSTTEEVDTPPNKAVPPNEEQMELLRIIAKYADWIPEQNVISSSSQTRVKTEFNLGELVRDKYLARDYRNKNKAYCLNLTHAGRAALVSTGEYDKNG